MACFWVHCDLHVRILERSDGCRSSRLALPVRSPSPRNSSLFPQAAIETNVLFNTSKSYTVVSSSGNNLEPSNRFKCTKKRLTAWVGLNYKLKLMSKTTILKNLLKTSRRSCCSQFVVCVELNFEVGLVVDLNEEPADGKIYLLEGFFFSIQWSKKVIRSSNFIEA